MFDYQIALVDASLGRDYEHSRVEKTPENKIKYNSLLADCNRIKSEGKSIDIPSEF